MTKFRAAKFCSIEQCSQTKQFANFGMAAVEPQWLVRMCRLAIHFRLRSSSPFFLAAHTEKDFIIFHPHGELDPMKNAVDHCLYFLMLECFTTTEVSSTYWILIIGWIISGGCTTDFATLIGS